MADKDTKGSDDGDKPDAPQGNELVSPADGASLRPAMAHRDSHTPMTKAE